MTNGLGMVGYALCCRLLEEGVEVAAIDDLTTGGEKGNKLDYFGRNALFTFYDGKLDQVALREAFEGADVCFYLLGELPPGQSVHQEIGEAFAQHRAIFEALPKKPPFFVLGSSCEVYNRSSGKIDKALDTVPGSRNGIVSLIEEVLWMQRDFPTAVLRLPEVDGLKPDGEGFQQRNFGKTPKRDPAGVLYLEQAVEAFISAADNEVPGIFNVTSRNAGQRRGENTPSEQSDKKDKQILLEKAEQAFGFQWKTSLKKGSNMHNNGGAAGTE